MAAACTAIAAGSSGMDERLCCHHCAAPTLRIDWAQGDCVCTSCGVVHDERLRDDRPEWRDYSQTNADEATGSGKERSGGVLVDEAKYFGGLQPTVLSSHVYGAPYKTSAATRKTLVKVNRRLDRNMERRHRKAVEDVRLVRRIAAQGRELQEDPTQEDIRPEIEQLLLQEEEDANRLHRALHANKWSLVRALRLFGTEQERPDACHSTEDDGPDDEVLDAKLDQQLRQCSRDLYQAYTMLHTASRKLALPDMVTRDAVNLLAEYATRRDGIFVRGVSSTLLRKPLPTDSHDNESKQQMQRAADALREYNKAKQAGALVAALLLYSGRRHAHERSIQEICTSIKPPVLENSGLDTSGDFIKKKHCARAMKEVEIFLPRIVVQSALTSTVTARVTKDSHNQSESVLNYVDHILQQLKLPPVAEASTRLLCVHWYQSHGHANVKFATICGAMVFLVCQAGSTMKRLASQATKRRRRNEKPLAVPSLTAPTNNAELQCEMLATDMVKAKEMDSWMLLPEENDENSSLASERREYEMMRVWDAWQEQMSWTRSVADIEQCCGSSSSLLLEYYRQNLFPAREELLNVLKESVRESSDQSLGSLRETSLASVLLPHITIAAPLLHQDGK